MSRRSLAYRLGGVLLVLWGLAPPAPAAETAASPTPRERRLQAIEGRLELLEHDYQRLQVVAGDDVPGARQAAGEALGEVRRLRDALESWLTRAEREPYRSNLDRFLRDLERRLGRLEIGLREPLAPPGGALPKRAVGDKPTRTSVPAGTRVGDDPPANDNCATATPVGVGTVSGDTTAATVDGEAGCGASNAGPDVWFRYTAAEAGEVVFDTFGAAFDTVLSLHSGCPGTAANELVCNDDEVGVQSRLSRQMVSGEQVLVRLGGFAGDYGTYLLTIGRSAEVAGVVTDIATGEGIYSATVTVYDESGDWAGSAQTDFSGAYTVTGLRAGVYFARADEYPYESQLFDGMPCPSYSCDPTSGTPIVLGPGGRATADFALHPGSSIAGRITSEATGAALPSVRVYAYDASGGYQDSDNSDSAGYYEISNLAPGTYFARAESDAGHLGELFDDIPCPLDCVPTQGTPIVLAEDDTAQADFALPLGGSIAGRVTASLTGQPLWGARVSLYDGTGGWVDSETTTSLGGFSIGGLVAGSYFAVASEGGYLAQLYDGLECETGCDATGGTPIAVTVGAETSGIDFALVRESAFSGLVTDANVGIPLADVRVEAWSSGGQWLGDGYSGQWGNFVVGELEAGLYFATTNNYQGYLDELYDDLPCPSGVCFPVTGTPITVATSLNTTGIDFALDLGGSISGRVTEVAAGQPVSGRVVVWDSGGAVVDEPWLGNGYYRLGGLTSGTYFVTTDTSSNDWADELYDDLPCQPSCVATTGTPLAVTTGVETSDVDFALCGAPNVEPRFPPSSDPDSFVDGCRVQVDGQATPYHPGCSLVSRVHWQWGDGKANDSPFPATHMYEPGNEWVTVYATAFDAVGMESDAAAKQLHLWDCLAPGSCGQPETRELFNLSLDSTHLIQACTDIVMGPGLHVLDPADVTIRAGGVVELRNGVYLEGGRVAIENDPALLP